MGYEPCERRYSTLVERDLSKLPWDEAHRQLADDFASLTRDVQRATPGEQESLAKRARQLSAELEKLIATPFEDRRY